MSSTPTERDMRKEMTRELMGTTFGDVQIAALQSKALVGEWITNPDVFLTSSRDAMHKKILAAYPVVFPDAELPDFHDETETLSALTMALLMHGEPRSAMENMFDLRQKFNRRVSSCLDVLSSGKNEGSIKNGGMRVQVDPFEVARTITGFSTMYGHTLKYAHRTQKGNKIEIDLFDVVRAKHRHLEIAGYSDANVRLTTQ